LQYIKKEKYIRLYYNVPNKPLWRFCIKTGNILFACTLIIFLFCATNLPASDTITLAVVTDPGAAQNICADIVVANLGWFSSLPEKDQKTIIEAVNEAARYEKEWKRKNETLFLENLKKSRYGHR